MSTQKKKAKKIVTKEEIKNMEDYYKAIASGDKNFENIYQALTRMILDREDAFRSINVCGEQVYDYSLFREGARHPIETYSVIEELVTFLRSAASFGPSFDQAFIIFGEPGNGKTNLINFMMKKFAKFLETPGNEKFTFRFKNLGAFKIGEDNLFGDIPTMESQTYEDPMILLMNFFESEEENRANMSRLGFSDADINRHWLNHRRLGADSDYIMNLVRQETDGNFDKAMEQFIELSPIRVSGSQGVMTGKITAKDKFTANASELVGRPSVMRTLHIKETNCPALIDVRQGVVARVAGGGILFVDEMFKHTEDYIKVFLGIIQDREIEVNGYLWQIDTFIVATSNNDNLAKYQSQDAESPILNRCKLVPMPHVVSYHQQQNLTRYCLGDTRMTTVYGKELHEDPNLVALASDICVVSRLPDRDELTVEELRLLCAGEAAGDKSPQTLKEVIDQMNEKKDFGERFGMKGINYRTQARAFLNLMSYTATHEGQCMFAYDMFRAFRRAIIDDVNDSADSDRFLKRLELVEKLYRARIESEIYNAYMDDPDAVKRSVLDYVNMIMGMKANNLSGDGYVTYRDPQTGEAKQLKFRDDYVKSVQQRMGVENESQRKEHISYLTGLYGSLIQNDPKYDFMDQTELVKAVTQVLLKSDIQGMGSLVGVLANRTQTENEKTYNRMMTTMHEKMGYCKTCAEGTIERYITPDV